ncbi:MAG TPA: AbrB/MazE/SpoVT family DNA-binding domain-containing protein [Usitatibacter sp.]|nr:AbrB/MazE/SpoVT family DNA-binding domain-containing protein [Usitatibacter sp.]
MATATITSKGQITIPKEVREALGVGTGDRVEFVAEEKGVYKVVAATRDVRHLKGLVAKPAKPVTLEAMKLAIAKGASGR